MARQFQNAQVPLSSVNDIVWVNAHVDGHSFFNNRNTLLLVRTVGSATNLTAITPGVTDAGAIPDKVLALAINQIHALRFEPNLYNQTDGTMWFGFDTLTAVQVAAIQM